MKKYLALIIILGAIAVSGVSFLAQAEPKAETVTTTVDTTAPAAMTATTTAVPAATAPVAAAASETGTVNAADAEKIAKDTAECTALAGATKDGVAPTDAEKDAALASCLTAKGHNVAPQAAPVMEKNKD